MKLDLKSLAGRVIIYSFYTLFFFVPLIWLPFNYELFEFNKMTLVYLLTSVILIAWVVRGIYDRKFEIRRTPLDLALLAFLIGQVLATIFSIDFPTSFLGYYGRFHGGLLSTISYLLLYWAFVSNLNRKQAFYCLYTLIFSAVLISIYAILEHPNPFFALYGENGVSFLTAAKTLITHPDLSTWKTLTSQVELHGIDYNFWAVSVEERVFATLGQPNWLAAFLTMIIFLQTSFLFIIRNLYFKIGLLVTIILVYLAFTFTYSRGGLLGLLVGLATMIILLLARKFTLKDKFILLVTLLGPKKFLVKTRAVATWVLALVVIVLLTNYFFGNALATRGGVSTQTQQPQVANSTSPTQLEVGGTQTAKIRTIVWSGSLEIFKHYPVIGSGVETFGYSYYQFRPAAHNLTSEWDYLYNKAHNEYLNFLATTGLVGLGTYLLLVGWFEFVAIKKIVHSQGALRLVSIALLAGYNAYLAQNFFGFSVVAIALLFSLFPTIFFLINDYQVKTFSLISTKRLSVLKNTFHRRVALALTFIIGLILILQIFGGWFADALYNNAVAGNAYEQSIKDLRQAITLAPYQPLYRSELAVNLAGYASAVRDTNKQKEAIKEAGEITTTLAAAYPKNIPFWHNKRTVDFYLAKIDKGHYFNLIKTAETLSLLAPTDASIQYDLALVYSYAERPKEAEIQLAKVLKLKPDYKEATLQLASVFQANGKVNEAINLLTNWLKKNPTDLEVQNRLQELKTS